MKFNIIHCKESDLQELYDGSALTFEGTTLDDNNLQWLVDWFNKHNCQMKRTDFYVVSGRLMNNVYHLTSSNAYLNSLNILCIKLSDLTEPKNIVMDRFEIGGRWFDDVVDGNKR